MLSIPPASKTIAVLIFVLNVGSSVHAGELPEGYPARVLVALNVDSPAGAYLGEHWVRWDTTLDRYVATHNATAPFTQLSIDPAYAASHEDDPAFAVGTTGYTTDLYPATTVTAYWRVLAVDYGGGLDIPLTSCALWFSIGFGVATASAAPR